MCKIEYTIEEIINHPKLSDDYKFDKIDEIINEQLFLDWLEKQEIGIPLETLGLKLDDLNDFYDVDDTDNQYIEQKFNTEHNFRVIRLYKYFGPISDNSRQFCKTLVRRTNLSLMRKEDIELLNSQNPGFGKGGSDTYSVFNWRGGANCKHKWVKYYYDEETMNLVQAPDQPQQTTVDGKVPYANGTNKPPRKRRGE
jgi:hypothetical protein